MDLHHVKTAEGVHGEAGWLSAALDEIRLREPLTEQEYRAVNELRTGILTIRSSAFAFRMTPLQRAMQTICSLSGAKWGYHCAILLGGAEAAEAGQGQRVEHAQWLGGDFETHSGWRYIPLLLEWATPTQTPCSESVRFVKLAMSLWDGIGHMTALLLHAERKQMHFFEPNGRIAPWHAAVCDALRARFPDYELVAPSQLCGFQATGGEPYCELYSSLWAALQLSRPDVDWAERLAALDKQQIRALIARWHDFVWRLARRDMREVDALIQGIWRFQELYRGLDEKLTDAEAMEELENAYRGVIMHICEMDIEPATRALEECRARLEVLVERSQAAEGYAPRPFDVQVY